MLMVLMPNSRVRATNGSKAWTKAGWQKPWAASTTITAPSWLTMVGWALPTTLPQRKWPR